MRYKAWRCYNGPAGKSPISARPVAVDHCQEVAQSDPEVDRMPKVSSIVLVKRGLGRARRGWLAWRYASLC